MKRLRLNRRFGSHMRGLRVRSALQRMTGRGLTVLPMRRRGLSLRRRTALGSAVCRRSSRMRCLFLLRRSMHRVREHQRQRQNRNSGQSRTGSEENPHVTTLGCRSLVGPLPTSFGRTKQGNDLPIPALAVWRQLPANRKIVITSAAKHPSHTSLCQCANGRLRCMKRTWPERQKLLLSRTQAKSPPPAKPTKNQPNFPPSFPLSTGVK